MYHRPCSETFHTLSSRMVADRVRGMLVPTPIPTPRDNEWGKFVTQASRGNHQTERIGGLSMTREACTIEGTAEK